MTLSARQGFTLVELLVVISIIAILSVIGITVFSGVQKQARDAKRRADLRAIGQALEIYKSINGLYPASNWVYSDSTNNPWIPGLDSSYMVSMPKDPKDTGRPGTGGNYTGAGYVYGYYATNYLVPPGTWFMLVARLEAGNSADAQTKCTSPPGLPDYPNGNVFNYSVNSSPDKVFMVCNQQ